MIRYASWTGTRRNKDALRLHGWRLLLSPVTFVGAGWRLPTWTDGTLAPFALDNGAWSAFQQGRPFDEIAFARAVEVAGGHEDWIVLPDIVAGGLPSLDFSLSWVGRLAARRCLLAVQDGMEEHHVLPHVGHLHGLFVGGSTAWKLTMMQRWGRFAHAHNLWCHVGRVNTARRIRMCLDAGMDSFDGTSPSRFAVTTPELTAAAEQNHLFRRRPA